MLPPQKPVQTGSKPVCKPVLFGSFFRRKLLNLTWPRWQTYFPARICVKKHSEHTGTVCSNLKNRFKPVPNRFANRFCLGIFLEKKCSCKEEKSFKQKTFGVDKLQHSASILWESWGLMRNLYGTNMALTRPLVKLTGQPWPST